MLSIFHLWCMWKWQILSIIDSLKIYLLGFCFWALLFFFTGYRILDCQIFFSTTLKILITPLAFGFYFVSFSLFLPPFPFLPSLPSLPLFFLTLPPFLLSFLRSFKRSVIATLKVINLLYLYAFKIFLFLFDF